MSVRLVVADDNHLLRTGLVTVLGSDPGVEVVGQAADGVEALRVALEQCPDVVLMDVEMPGGDGITATRAVTDALSGTRVLMLTMFDLDDYVAEALRAGASGYLLKTASPQELLAGVTACAAGDRTMAPSVMDRLVRSFLAHRPAPVPATLETLTAREIDVLLAMTGGLSNAEIALQLHLAETTVKTHVGRILLKLGARDRLQAVVAAHRHGLRPAP